MYMKKTFGERNISGLIMISLPINSEEFTELQMSRSPLLLLNNEHKQASSLYIVNVENACKGVALKAPSILRAAGVHPAEAAAPDISIFFPCQNSNRT